MSKFWIIAGSLSVVVVIVGVFFSQDIRMVATLYDYQKTFDPDVMDHNFRSMYERQNAIRIVRPNDVYELSEKLDSVSLPDTYVFEGEKKDLKTLLENTQTTGFAVFHKGQLVYEMYDRGNTPDSLSLMASVSKGMASFLVGVALEEGDIKSVDDLVTDYVPALEKTAYEGVTLKNVLEMSSGVQWVEDFGDLNSELVQSIVAMRLGSLDQFTAGVPREFSPGTYHRYASIDTHVVGMVLRAATGKPYSDYLSEKLWSRIGAQADAYLLTDSVNEPLVYGGMNITLRDMVRFGALYLHKGRNLRGQQLVSEDWIKISTTPDEPRLMPGADNPQSASPDGYKYQWWIPANRQDSEYTGLGAFGQVLYIDPDADLVIAKTSAYQNYTVDGDRMFEETVAACQSIARYLAK